MFLTSPFIEQAITLIENFRQVRRRRCEATFPRRACLNWTVLDPNRLPSARQIEVFWLSASFAMMHSPSLTATGELSGTHKNATELGHHLARASDAGPVGVRGCRRHKIPRRRASKPEDAILEFLTDF
jgi:hypothetical protein